MKFSHTSSKLKDYGLSLLSAGLLIFAFPETDGWIFAWFGLVPLLVSLDGRRPGQAFRRAYVVGMAFFTGTLFWFFHLMEWFSFIAAAGVILLFAYLALYFGLFGWLVSAFSRKKFLHKLFLLPSGWVVLEWIRGHLFTGFGWVNLGHSQYQNLPVIQIADITGVYGVSFVVVMVNVLIAECVLKLIARQHDLFRAVRIETGIVVGILFGVLLYGYVHLWWPSRGPNSEEMTVALVQANTPQMTKWHRPSWPFILEDYLVLTDQAVTENPDLIVWPETSFPGHLWEEDDQALFDRLKRYVQRIQIPLLVGSITKEGDDYYNSALLLSAQGEIIGQYRKVHLVPFGEFLPFRRLMPFLAEILGTGDFTPGKEWTVFPSINSGGDLNATRGQFSVLICFEDTVAWLSRRFVREGAQWLVNMTNDAWFHDSAAPFMHLQSSVFRTVENRRTLVRAANTGVSCVIDPRGKINACVAQASEPVGKKTYISGYTIGKVEFQSRKTLYTKLGDIFTILCFSCILCGIVVKNH